MKYQQDLLFKGEVIQGNIGDQQINFCVRLGMKPPSSIIHLTKEEFNQFIEEMLDVKKTMGLTME